MTEEQFAKIESIRGQICKSRKALATLKSSCFIYLERNEIRTYIQDEEVTKVLINLFEERISKLEKQFAEL